MTSAETSILQARLHDAGYDPGPQDGALGSHTYSALFSYMAGHNLGDRAVALGKGASAHFPAYDINTPLRIAHFLAQAAHETGGFKWLHELWGPTPAQARYEGRRDLGNTHPGDGERFKGRGIFQLTGRGNYASYGEVLHLDLVDHPEIAEDPEVSVLIACAYWKLHGLNDLADADDVERITRRINGGLNGFDDRKAMLAKAKRVLT
jgi:putative chitinase